MQLFNLAAGATQADLYLYGTIWNVGLGPDDITAKKFVDELNALPGSVHTVEIHINSDGGNVLQGLAMIAALDAYRLRNKRVITTVEGAALSMAFVIAQAGTERRMSANALAMIHEIQGGDYGSLSTIKQTAIRMEKAQQQIINIFARRSGRSPADIEAYMQNGAETWFSAEEAQSAGLIDVVTGSLAIAAEATRFNVPERFRRASFNFGVRHMDNFNQWPPVVGQTTQQQPQYVPFAGPAMPAAQQMHNQPQSQQSAAPAPQQYAHTVPAQAFPAQPTMQGQTTNQTVALQPAATAQELRNAFPNAPDGWIVSQLLANAPLQAASVNYANYVEQQMRQLQSAQQPQPQPAQQPAAPQHNPTQPVNQFAAAPQSPVAAGQVGIGIAAGGPVNQAEAAHKYRVFLNQLRDAGVAPAEAMRRASLALPQEMLAYQAEWQERQSRRPSAAVAAQR